jgi:indole-3-glycerol phosphate synthase
MNRESQIFIGEIKVKSPFTKLNRPKSFDKLMRLCINHADCISVHTDARWGGSFENIRKVFPYTTSPILAKGIHGSDVEIREAMNMGATYVLVVGRIPEDEKLLPYCWLEPTNLKQLDEFCSKVECTMVWNSRNLEDGCLKEGTFDDALKLTKSQQLIQASNIRSVEDVHPLASGYIVGTYLPQFIKSIKI